MLIHVSLVDALTGRTVVDSCLGLVSNDGWKMQLSTRAVAGRLLDIDEPGDGEPAVTKSFSALITGSVENKDSVAPRQMVLSPEDPRYAELIRRSYVALRNGTCLAVESVQPLVLRHGNPGGSLRTLTLFRVAGGFVPHRLLVQPAGSSWSPTPEVIVAIARQVLPALDAAAVDVRPQRLDDLVDGGHVYALRAGKVLRPTAPRTALRA